MTGFHERWQEQRDARRKIQTDVVVQELFSAGFAPSALGGFFTHSDGRRVNHQWLLLHATEEQLADPKRLANRLSRQKGQHHG